MSEAEIQTYIKTEQNLTNLDMGRGKDAKENYKTMLYQGKFAG